MGDDNSIAVIISADRKVHDQVETALAAGSLAESVWTVADYPDLPDLERLKQIPSGCVLFLDFDDPMRARRVAAELDRSYPQVSVVAVRSGHTKDDLIQLMQLGIREVVSDPAHPGEVSGAYMRALRKIGTSRSTTGHIYAFLPAKPGAGATTIAIQTAWTAARLLGGRTLMLDFDLRLGITSFLMKLDGRHCVQDALNVAQTLDEDVWAGLVCHRQNLDVLGSAPQDLLTYPEEAEYKAVLGCAQKLYDATCVDLAGSMEPHELETLRRAREIYLVCTADVAGLHMAKRKSDTLQQLHLKDKVSVVLNRVERRSSLPTRDIEGLLDLPVRFVVPSDEKSIARAVQAGTPIEQGSPIAVQVDALARSIKGGPVPVAAPPTRKFVEYFSVSPAREWPIWKR